VNTGEEPIEVGDRVEVRLLGLGLRVGNPMRGTVHQSIVDYRLRVRLDKPFGGAQEFLIDRTDLVRKLTLIELAAEAAKFLDVEP